MTTSIDTKSAIATLVALEAIYENSGADLDCAIEVSNGEWGGFLTTVKLSPLAAIHLARQLLQMANKDFDGAHFHIDKASIAPESTDQLILTLAASGS